MEANNMLLGICVVDGVLGGDDYNVIGGSMYYEKTMSAMFREREILHTTVETVPVERTVPIAPADAAHDILLIMEDIAATTQTHTDTSGTTVASGSSNFPGMSPAKKTSGRVGDISGRGVTSEQMKSSRVEEAESDYKAYFRKGVANIIGMAAPCSGRYQAAAAQAAVAIAMDLEAHITAISAPSSCSPSSSDIISVSQSAMLQSMAEKTVLADNNDLANVHSLCIDKSFTNEAILCKLFASFIRCVARRVAVPSMTITAGPEDHVLPRRLIFPVMQMDFKCRDANVHERIDIGIACASPDSIVDDLCPTNILDAGYQNASRDKPGYVDLLMIVEAKYSSTHMKIAHTQLFRYTRMLYQSQHNRQLAWGMVLCGTCVQVCLFTPTDVLASNSIDMATSSGRGQLIRLFVNLSFCEDHRLGYDPTIIYIPELQCWKIQVPENDDDGSETDMHFQFKTYYSNSMVVSASRLCGRHTRCFLAVSETPTIDNPIEGMAHNVIVKDAWPESNVNSNEDTRDEIRFLRRINHKLAGNSKMAGKYPIIEAGGRVYFQHSEGSKWTLDMARGHPPSPQQGGTLDSIEASSQQVAKCPVRVHKRVAVSPVGRPLNKLKSAYELVIVIADAMHCHSEITTKCKILHRDISWNNVLFRREAGSVQGMLIDFDCALDLAILDTCSRTERTGTGPFMSVVNLESSTVPRSALDDWESVIYLLCWYGVFGLNGATEPENDGSYRRIHKWIEGDPMAIAREKRGHLHSYDNFRQITNEFCPKMNPEFDGSYLLTDLAHLLRYVLIDDHEDIDSRGEILPDGYKTNLAATFAKMKLKSAIKIDNVDTSSKPRPDPFTSRARRADEIASTLMVVLDKYSEKIKESLCLLANPPAS
ncbi:hypothetical protein H4R24_004676 [Coemansia sp. RSA 988]|nr:hypothetical protein H4R24_004676 [Coemansia sp. RSA 988]